MYNKVPTDLLQAIETGVSLLINILRSHVSCGPGM